MRSFLIGMASIFDFWGFLTSWPEPFENDEDAILSDWQAVGDDIRRAMGMID